MDVNDTETSGMDVSTNARPVFFCPQHPHLSWYLKNTTIPRILVVIKSFASPVTILLNLLVIIAVKRRKELQKPVNILLSSMAVADLLVGAISMPLSSTVDILILHNTSLEHICTLDSMANKPLLIFLCSCSLYHLTWIAWDRYMAIHKFIDYKVIVTKGLLQKLSIAAWLLSVLTMVAHFTAKVVEADREAVHIRLNVEAAVAIIWLVAVTYFYIMVYLGVRKRKINEIGQANVLIKVKLESKVAKTTCLLTVGLILSFLPGIGVLILPNTSLVFATNSFSRLGEALVQLNSLVSPILYCYRDSKFRKATLELLGMRKLNAVQLGHGSGRFVRRNDPLMSVKRLEKSVGYKKSMELLSIPTNPNENRRRQLCMQPPMTRSASCDGAIFIDCVHRPAAKSHEMLLRRKRSVSI